MAHNSQNPVSVYLATIGSRGGKAGSTTAKSKAGKLGARIRWNKRKATKQAA